MIESASSGRPVGAIDESDLVDLSHLVDDGLITYKGLPAPVICDFLSREASRQHYAASTEFHIGKIEMVANTSTYVDSPFHRYADGKDLSEHPLSSRFDACVGQIVHCLEQLSEEQVWWRPHESMNSIGNLVLHLTGNIRQEIICLNRMQLGDRYRFQSVPTNAEES